MGIGGLLTIGLRTSRRTFRIAVLDNGHYGETGMQRSHSGLGAKLRSRSRAARACTSVVEITDYGRASRAFRTKIIASGGAAQALVRISTDHVDRALPPRRRHVPQEPLSPASRLLRCREHGDQPSLISHKPSLRQAAVSLREQLA